MAVGVNQRKMSFMHTQIRPLTGLCGLQADK